MTEPTAPQTPTEAAVAAVIRAYREWESGNTPPLEDHITAALSPFLIARRDTAREILARNLMAKESYWDDIDETSRDDVRRRADAILTAITGSAKGVTPSGE